MKKLNKMITILDDFIMRLQDDYDNYVEFYQTEEDRSDLIFIQEYLQSKIENDNTKYKVIDNLSDNIEYIYCDDIDEYMNNECMFLGDDYMYDEKSLLIYNKYGHEILFVKISKEDDYDCELYDFKNDIDFKDCKTRDEIDKRIEEIRLYNK